MNYPDKTEGKSNKIYFVIYLILGLIALLLIDALVLSWRL